MPQSQHVLEATFDVDARPSYRTVGYKEDRENPYRLIRVRSLVVSCPVCEAPNPRRGILFRLGEREDKGGAMKFSDAAMLVVVQSREDFKTDGNYHPVLRACPGCGVVFTITEGVILELQERARVEVPAQLEELLARAG